MNGFMLGAATAAHQVEGNNVHSDYWAMEHMRFSGFAEPSLNAVEHYSRYEEDILLLKNAGLNAYRFSVEWARVEPSENAFDAAEIEHYRRVIKFCRDNGVEPLVTLHHFSSPLWLIKKGGWETENVVTDFGKYALRMAQELGGELNYICTINEANMGVQVAAIGKRFLAQMAANSGKTVDGDVQVGLNIEKMMRGREEAAKENAAIFGTPSPATFVSPRTERGDELVMKAHRAAVEAVKSVCPHISVGLSLSLHDIQAVEGGEQNAEKEWYDEFTHYLPYIKGDDFLGVQNYTRSLIGQGGVLPAPDGSELTQMNYEFYPEALGNVVRKAAKDFSGSIIVTENGIATADDERRALFIKRAMDGIKSCVTDGLPVKGFFYWSLLDNFEWQKGFSMTFGLIGVDRTTQKRLPKPSLNFLGEFLRKETRDEQGELI